MAGTRIVPKRTRQVWGPHVRARVWTMPCQNVTVCLAGCDQPGTVPGCHVCPTTPARCWCRRRSVIDDDVPLIVISGWFLADRVLPDAVPGSHMCATTAARCWCRRRSVIDVDVPLIVISGWFLADRLHLVTVPGSGMCPTTATRRRCRRRPGIDDDVPLIVISGCFLAGCVEVPGLIVAIKPGLVCQCPASMCSSMPG